MTNIDQVIEKPTYYQNIRAMFSQYDRVMMLNSFDSLSYEEVKNFAGKIYLAIQPNPDPNMAAVGWSMLQQVHIMPEVGGPWPDTWVKTFKNWIDTGCPAGNPPTAPVPVVPADKLQLFIALSKALTGIDDFGANEQSLAAIYYNRMLKRPIDKPNNTLADVLTAWSTNPDASALSKSFTICADIILIWYNTTTMWDDRGNSVNVPYFGTPEFNQYQEGQSWKVALCHPMGYAPENTPFYWRSKPSADGQFSGFYNKYYSTN